MKKKNDYIHVLNRKYVNSSIIILKITFAAILDLQTCLCEILFYDSSYFITYEIVFEHIWSCNLHYFIYKLLCNCGANQKTFIRKINRNCNEPSWLSEKHRVFLQATRSRSLVPRSWALVIAQIPALTFLDEQASDPP